jgi:hypothetical protein
MRSSSPSCLASRMKRGRIPGDQFTRLRASPPSGDPRSGGSENERVACSGAWPSDGAGVMKCCSWQMPLASGDRGQPALAPVSTHRQSIRGHPEHVTIRRRPQEEPYDNHKRQYPLAAGGLDCRPLDPDHAQTAELRGRHLPNPYRAHRALGSLALDPAPCVPMRSGGVLAHPGMA